TCYNQIPRNGTRYDPGFAAGDDLGIYQFIDGGSQERWRQYYQELAINGNNVTRPLYSYWHNIEGWSALWKAIRDCNTFIANVHKERDLDSYEREKWIAEAKTLKAYCHFYLVQLYGPIPIARESLAASASSEELMVYREPIDEVDAYIVQLLDEAIPNLDLKVDNMVSDAGRVTRPVAAAIKAKVLVTAASPLFNGNQEYAHMIDKRGIALFNTVEDPNKRTLAAESAKEAI